MGTLGVWRGAALYGGSLIGPGVLLVPALALQAAGPASVIAWALLIALSAPLAFTFAALGTRQPVAGGVAAYVESAFGTVPGVVTGGWFLTAVLIGTPTVSLIGGYYVAVLTGGGTGVAAAVGLAIFAVVLAANAFGIRLSSRLQFGLVMLLTSVIAVAVAVALPGHLSDHWTPFAPQGWLAVGSAANILMWLFVGWEAVAQLAGEFENPGSQLPRAMLLAFCGVTILYLGIAVATVVVTTNPSSTVPLADLMAVGFGRWGRDVTAVLAVTLTMGTMNVYLGGASKLAAFLATTGSLPRWLAGDAYRSIPRRPLLIVLLVGLPMLGALIAGFGSDDGLVRATSACFVAVYVAATAAAVRTLRGRGRVAALISCAMTTIVAAFSAWFLLVPAVSCAGFVLLQAYERRRKAQPM